jgi:cytochrome bd-type quinol oxidase subunit 2
VTAGDLLLVVAIVLYGVVVLDTVTTKRLDPRARAVFGIVGAVLMVFALMVLD